MDVNSLLQAGKEIFVKGLAFGKKNAPILMTGSSIAIGWFAVYLFWKESKKADTRIAYEEKRYNEEQGLDEDDEKLDLPRKEKVRIYFEYCWMSLLLGVTSSGLAIAGQKLSLDRLAEMYVMTQFLTEKNEKKDKLIEKVKEEVGDKKFKAAENEILEDDFTIDEVLDAWNAPGASGNVVVRDHVMHYVKRMPIELLDKGIAKSNDILKERFDKLKAKYRDSDFNENSPFYVRDEVRFTNLKAEEEAYYTDLHSSMDLGEFLEQIGMVNHDSFGIRIAEINEFRYYGGKNPLPKSQLLSKFGEFTTPDGERFTVIDLDYTELLCPTNELIERNPL